MSKKINKTSTIQNILRILLGAFMLYAGIGYLTFLSTEFHNEGPNGVRSISEDKNGDFWFNTEYRYSVYDSTTLKSDKFYTRKESIGV